MFFKQRVYVSTICMQLCNRCHDLLTMSMNLSNTVILKIKNTDYCCIITGIGI